MEKLGIIAGGGLLPAILAEYCKAQSIAVHIIGLDGFADHQKFESFSFDTVPMSRVGKIIRLLKEQSCSHICMIGPVKKPSFRTMIPDARGALLLPKILAAAGQGDDAILRLVIDELEAEGFIVTGIQEIMGGVLPDKGPLGSVAPDESSLKDIAVGFDVAKRLGTLDIGQAVIIQQGIVIGVEGVEGTDRLIERCSELMFEGAKGVLVKACKPQQDRRADLPTIGVQTIEKAAAAGLQGIAIEAGYSLVVDAKAVKQKADDLGLFVHSYVYEG